MKPIGLSIVALSACVMMFSQSAPLQTWNPVWQWSKSNVTCLNERERIDLIKRADHGDAKAQDTLGTDYLASCGANQPLVKGVDLLERAAIKGNVHAQLTLGRAFAAGEGVPKDEVKAASWIRKAAATGDAKAQNDLGVTYELGAGLAKDPARAAQLFQSAAEQGLPEAQLNFASALDRGIGIPQSYELARKWYMKAAEHKDSAAEYRLGMLYESGLGGDKDSARAMIWFERAADDGSEDAQVRLGRKSPSEAKTIDSGYFQYMIGVKMLRGEGLEKDVPKGIAFLKKSAEAGYPPAMVRLAAVFADGSGVDRDEAQALEYCKSAIARDDKYAGGYNELAWILVTAVDSKLRDAVRAREYALKAVALSNGTNANYLDTLAHAYFQTGEIDKAIETETTAAALAPENKVFQKTLQDYKTAQRH